MNMLSSLNLLPLGLIPDIVRLQNRKQITCLLGRRIGLRTIMRYLFPLAAIVCAIIAPRIALADSIIIDGVAISNVYIGAGKSMYYIQDPADGSTISVPKSEIDASDITFSSDRMERRKLREAWKLQRAQRAKGQPLTISYEDWRSQLGSTIPAIGSGQATITLDEPVLLNGIRGEQSDDGVIHMSNRETPQKARDIKGRKVYMGPDGVAIMTNTPEQFRDSKYVEVVLHYDQIDVPERFRVAPTRSRGTGPDMASLDSIIDYYAKRYRIDVNLLYAIIKSESNGNQYAVSPAGARGLMQLMPGTAREMGVKDIFDPAQNIAGGTQYVSKLATLYDGDWTMALAGYNAGPGNVRKYGGIPPFDETRQYIRRVLQLQRTYERQGTPNFQVADLKPVEENYLPPESSRYYQIVLDNGLTLAAEEVYEDDDQYIYVFKGRSGHFPHHQVVAVYKPS